MNSKAQLLWLPFYSWEGSGVLEGDRVTWKWHFLAVGPQIFPLPLFTGYGY